MPVARPINLNDSLPAPPLGRTNIRWQGDDADPRNVSAYPLIGGVNPQTGTSYTIVADDHGRLVTLQNGAAVAVTLPTATSFVNGFWLMVENLGAGAVTITPTTSTIDGFPTLTLQQNQGAVIFSDGTNYYTMRGIGGGGPQSLPLVIGFIIGDGTSGTNVGPMLAAPRGGEVSSCVVVVKQSDPSVALKFIIRQNGGSVFSSTPQIAPGTSEGTKITISPLVSDPLTVLDGDVFSIDIEQGTDQWQFTAQLE